MTLALKIGNAPLKALNAHPHWTSSRQGLLFDLIIMAKSCPTNGLARDHALAGQSTRHSAARIPVHDCTRRRGIGASGTSTAP